MSFAAGYSLRMVVRMSQRCQMTMNSSRTMGLSPNYLPQRCLSTTCRVLVSLQHATSPTSVLTQKKRVTKKKPVVEKPHVLAYATNEEYNLEGIAQRLSKQGLYLRRALPEEADAIHARARYLINGQNRDIFLFREGSIVFWNFSKTEANSVLEFLRPFERGSYREDIVDAEVEAMEFCRGHKTRIVNGRIELRQRDVGANVPASTTTTEKGTVHAMQDNVLFADDAEVTPEELAESLEMYAFSNGMALSVKLAIWEATLEEYVDSIETFLKDIERGRKLSVTRKEVFRKTGELFSLRHRLNLSSDLLDPPDFYWDRENLEALFVQTMKTYAINRRTRIMNERIQHCQELMQLVSHHLEDKHHVRLELMIIILIVAEVMFEIVHYVERFSPHSRDLPAVE